MADPSFEPISLAAKSNHAFINRLDGNLAGSVRWVAPVARLRATGVAQPEEVAIIQSIELAHQLTFATRSRAVISDRFLVDGLRACR